jgi:hypothetical protein
MKEETTGGVVVARGKVGVDTHHVASRSYLVLSGKRRLLDRARTNDRPLHATALAR